MQSPRPAVASHPLLDRLIHGRAWIGIVAFALIGIVTMQLGLLKLNAGIGRALEHEAALQRENSALSVENSEVAGGDTVELQAAHMGMQLIPTGALRFLSAQGGAKGDLGRALGALSARASAQAQTPTSTSSEAATPTPKTEATSQASGEEATTQTQSESSETSPSSSAASSESAAATTATGGESAAGAPTASTSTPTTTAAPSEAGGATAGPQG